MFAKILLLVLPLALSAMQITDERNDKWLLAVEKALSSQEYCQELKALVVAPEADLEVMVVLREILRDSCCSSN